MVRLNKIRCSDWEVKTGNSYDGINDFKYYSDDIKIVIKDDGGAEHIYSSKTKDGMAKRIAALNIINNTVKEKRNGELYNEKLKLAARFSDLKNIMPTKIESVAKDSVYNSLCTRDGNIFKVDNIEHMQERLERAVLIKEMTAAREWAERRK